MLIFVIYETSDDKKKEVQMLRTRSDLLYFRQTFPSVVLFNTLSSVKLYDHEMSPAFRTLSLVLTHFYMFLSFS